MLHQSTLYEALTSRFGLPVSSPILPCIHVHVIHIDGGRFHLLKSILATEIVKARPAELPRSIKCGSDKMTVPVGCSLFFIGITS